MILPKAIQHDRNNPKITGVRCGMICRRQYSSVEKAKHPLAFIPLGMSQAQRTHNNGIVSCWNIPNGMCCHRGGNVSTEL
jgi:hypothetical protein